MSYFFLLCCKSKSLPLDWQYYDFEGKSLLHKNSCFVVDATHCLINLFENTTFIVWRTRSFMIYRLYFVKVGLLNHEGCAGCVAWVRTSKPSRFITTGNRCEYVNYWRLLLWNWVVMVSCIIENINCVCVCHCHSEGTRVCFYSTLFLSYFTHSCLECHQLA